MEDCAPHVLATVVDFIYGIKIPADISSEDAKSLLAMADLYLMEDLKDAVGSLIATKLDILEMSQMAEKCCAQKLKEVCYEFIFKNLNTLDKKMLVELNEVMPLLGEKAWLELINKGRSENSTDFVGQKTGSKLIVHSIGVPRFGVRILAAELGGANFVVVFPS